MARLLIHNAWEGCGVLVEYRGTARSPVYLELQTVVGAAATTLASRTLMTDVNGFAHWVYDDANSLAAGTELAANAIAL